MKDEVWAAAKAQARDAIIERARRRADIPYSVLCEKITAASFDPHGVPLAHLLGELSKEEFVLGRGMLTALVVHKSGDKRPGGGFYELAEELGLDVSDIEKTWIEQFTLVHETWAPKRTPPK